MSGQVVNTVPLSSELAAHYSGGPRTAPATPRRHQLSPRARSRSTHSTATAPVTPTTPVSTPTAAPAPVSQALTTYVLELDLTSVPSPRAAVLGTVTHALLTAVRRFHRVTDVELVSDAVTILISHAHDLTRDALTTRISDPSVTSAAPLTTPRIALTDQPTLTSTVFTIPTPAPEHLLSATLGPVELRPFARPGPTGYPDISFRPTALLGVSCRDSDLDPPVVARILAALPALLPGRESAP